MEINDDWAGRRARTALVVSNDRPSSRPHGEIVARVIGMRESELEATRRVARDRRKGFSKP